MTTPFRVFLGWDASQMRAWNVAKCSLQRHASIDLDIRRITMEELRAREMYGRPTQLLEHGYWDVISGAPMATAHAIARFFVPHLCGYQGWALFADGDVLFRRDVAELLALADDSKSVQVVQHEQKIADTTKMSGEAQTTYARKNWSSIMLLNCGHLFNRALTPELLNCLPGRMLHRFCWLEDAQIGALPAEWNVLIGEQDHSDPAIAHFTLGLPDLPGYETQSFADEWRAVAKAIGYRLEDPRTVAC
jgi:hypothetical protein